MAKPRGSFQSGDGQGASVSDTAVLGKAITTPESWPARLSTCPSPWLSLERQSRMVIGKARVPWAQPP